MTITDFVYLVGSVAPFSCLKRSGLLMTRKDACMRLGLLFLFKVLVIETLAYRVSIHPYASIPAYILGNAQGPPTSDVACRASKADGRAI